MAPNPHGPRSRQEVRNVLRTRKGVCTTVVTWRRWWRRVTNKLTRMQKCYPENCTFLHCICQACSTCLTSSAPFCRSQDSTVDIDEDTVVAATAISLSSFTDRLSFVLLRKKQYHASSMLTASHSVLPLSFRSFFVLLFRRLISEVAWPIVTKLCHIFDGDSDL